MNIIAALEQIFGTDSLGAVAGIVGRGFTDIPKKWREDAARIVAFVGATFDLIDAEYAKVVLAIRANDPDAAGRALVGIEALRVDAQRLAGAFINRAITVSKRPWAFVMSDPFKGEREQAKAMARKYDYPADLKARIGA